MPRFIHNNIQRRALSYIASTLCGGLVRNILSYFDFVPSNVISALSLFLVDESLVIMFATPSFLLSFLISDMLGKKGPLFYVVFGATTGFILSLIGTEVLGGLPQETFWEAFAREGPTETIAGTIAGLVQWRVGEK